MTDLRNDRQPWTWLGVYFLGILTGICLLVPPPAQPLGYMDGFRAGLNAGQAVRREPDEPAGCALDAVGIEHSEEFVR